MIRSITESLSLSSNRNDDHWLKAEALSDWPPGLLPGAYRTAALHNG